MPNASARYDEVLCFKVRNGLLQYQPHQGSWSPLLQCFPDRPGRFFLAWHVYYGRLPESRHNKPFIWREKTIVSLLWRNFHYTSKKGEHKEGGQTMFFRNEKREEQEEEPRPSISSSFVWQPPIPPEHRASRRLTNRTSAFTP